MFPWFQCVERKNNSPGHIIHTIYHSIDINKISYLPLLFEGRNFQWSYFFFTSLSTRLRIHLCHFSPDHFHLYYVPLSMRTHQCCIFWSWSYQGSQHFYHFFIQIWKGHIYPLYEFIIPPTILLICLSGVKSTISYSQIHLFLWLL